jgi:TRAP-type C4-dicarboxylate transport system substrate-binding protein
VDLPYGQVETGLATGLVDGAENNWPSFVTTGHYKYARNYTLTEHTMSPEVLIMSLRAWQSLSDADRAIFREAARESNRFMRDQWTALETQSARVARQNGVTIVSDFDRKPFEAAMAKIHAQAATDPVIGPMIDRIRQVK